MAVDHRQPADLVLLHGCQGFADIVIDTDGHGLALGHLTRRHRRGVTALRDTGDHDVPIDAVDFSNLLVIYGS
ncbi:hypothetical protein GCM10009628_42400 [Paeniglutamicibacter kerguelensis]